MSILRKESTFSILYNHFYKTSTSDYLLYTLLYNNNNNYYYYYHHRHLNKHDSHFLKSLPLSHPKPSTHTTPVTLAIADTTVSSSFALIPSQNHVIIIIFFFYKLPITQIKTTNPTKSNTSLQERQQHLKLDTPSQPLASHRHQANPSCSNPLAATLIPSYLISHPMVLIWFHLGFG